MIILTNLFDMKVNINGKIIETVQEKNRCKVIYEEKLTSNTNDKYPKIGNHIIYVKEKKEEIDNLVYNNFVNELNSYGGK